MFNLSLGVGLGTIREILPFKSRCTSLVILGRYIIKVKMAFRITTYLQMKCNDVTVIFLGLPNELDTEGADRDDLEMPKNQNLLVSEIIKVQSNTVIVLHNGAPVTMPWVNNVSAILEMYLSGDACGEAAVSILFGETNPSGKLAESFPIKLSDTPSYLNFPGERGRVEYREGVFVGYRYYDKKEMNVLFPFGHGLSYTSFEYNNLRLDKHELDDVDTVNATVTITTQIPA